MGGWVDGWMLAAQCIHSFTRSLIHIPWAAQASMVTYLFVVFDLPTVVLGCVVAVLAAYG
jgi:hypothetical protein